VGFDQVGGLDHYVKALKEMVFLPLVYPELFQRFHIAPPRGVLFYGPPGARRCTRPTLLLLSTQLQQLHDAVHADMFCILGWWPLSLITKTSAVSCMS
jgi:hypothetical protein